MRDDDESLDAVRTKGDQDPRCAHPELMSNAWTVREISPAGSSTLISRTPWFESRPPDQILEKRESGYLWLLGPEKRRDKPAKCSEGGIRALKG